MKDLEKSNEKDAFWDLEALLPTRPKAHTVARTVRDIQTVEITQSTPSEKPYSVEDFILTEHYVHPQKAEEKPLPQSCYHPVNSLLHEVRVYGWKNDYDYYERFRLQAQKFWHIEGKECPLVPFFSYMPQYTQLNAEQLKCYFWWRTSFRKGVFLPVEYSYLLLALYELIHIEKEESPLEIQAQMVRIWLAYRTEHPRLDALVREWLCDYSLLHQLPPPPLPTALYRGLLSGCRLKEFYVPFSEGNGSFVDAVLLFCNNYDYTKSKFFNDGTKEEYHRVLRGALEVALAYLRERDGNLLTGSGGVSTISRDTFVGAICSYRYRRRIEVDYTSFSHTHELRYIVSDVLKYAENALRGARGVKSRLTVYAVDVALRERLDAYLARAVPPKAVKAPKKEQEMPLYERRYDLPATALSVERAAEIEANSWQTTKRLVEAFEQECAVAEPAPPPDVEKIEPPAPKPGGGSAREVLGELYAFLPLVDKGDVAAQRRFAREQGMLLDAVVDKINTVASDMLGDVVLEMGDTGYVLIEDYREWLNKEGIL